MKFLPVAERELRVAARRPSTYWLRFSVAGGLLVLATWVFLTSQRAGHQESGRMIFYLLTGGLTLYALTAGVRSTADCLSEEKREGTLGLLFLTDLRGYDVVAGKLVANSLHVFYGVLAVLPIIAVPLLMGGVTGAEFARLALVLVNTLFFSLSAGMLASALCQNARPAVALALGIILLVAAGSPLLGLLEWKLRNWNGRYQEFFLIPSPGFSYFAGVEDLYKRGFGTGYYWSVGIVHALGWSFLALASWAVKHRWQDQPVLNRGVQRLDSRSNDGAGGATPRDKFRTRLLDQNAYYWLASRPWHRALWAWWPLVFGGAVWIWGGNKFGAEWFDPAIYVATAFLLSTTMKALIGAEAGRQILEDRRIGAMELLLSTSLSVRDILRGQWLALRRQFLPPVLVMFLACFAMWMAGFSEMYGAGNSYWFWIGLGGMVMFVADAIALYWMGLWLGLSARNPRRAFGSAVAAVLTQPWIAVALVMTLGAFLPRDLQRELKPEVLVWVLWFGFSMIVDFGYSAYARHKLLTSFRTTAAQRFQSKPTLWQRLTGTR